MEKFIINFGFYGDDGYTVSKSYPIIANDENDASEKFKDQFESYDGIECDVINVTKIK